MTYETSTVQAINIQTASTHIARCRGGQRKLVHSDHLRHEWMYLFPLEEASSAAQIK
jgi:hypothetical protein